MGIAALSLFGCSQKKTITDDSVWLRNGIETAQFQLKMTAEAIDSKNSQDTAVFPRSILNPKPMAEKNPQNRIDSLRLEKPRD